jgi:molybdate transport system ATP-binding protein
MPDAAKDHGVSLLLKNVRLELPSFTLEVDAEVHGRITAIVGPSGSGKTTLLEIIAGLRPADAGLIRLNGVVLTDTASRLFVPTRERGVGYVPQDLALFPHLTVRGNLLYGKKHDGDALFAFDHVVGTLEIGHLVNRSIGRLSGGEKQRVALARALLASPRMLLLDEPLSSLDSRLKERVLRSLARVRDEFRVPMLYVTHDVAEIRELCDAVLPIENGRSRPLESVPPG